MTRIAILIALAAAGCETVPRTVEILKEVLVQVPVPCIDPKEKPLRPALLTDAELNVLDNYRWAWAMWGDRLERRGYEAKLEAIVKECSRIPAARAP